MFLCFHILLLTQFLLWAFWFCVPKLLIYDTTNFVSLHFFVCFFNLFALTNEMLSEVKCFSFERKRNFLKGLPIFLAETCLFRVFEPLRRKWNSVWVRENCGSDFAPSWRASVVEQVSFIVDFSSLLNTMLLMLSIVSRKYLINRLAQ